ncbi:hypothetical protein [Ketobacter sp.]
MLRILSLIILAFATGCLFTWVKLNDGLGLTVISCNQQVIDELKVLSQSLGNDASAIALQSTKFLGQSLTAPSNDEPQIIKRHPSDLDSKISNQNKAYEEANAFLNTKINEGFWNDEDRDQFRTTFDVLHPEDRKKLLNKLILAINSGGLKLLVGPDMPFY